MEVGIVETGGIERKLGKLSRTEVLGHELFYAQAQVAGHSANGEDSPLPWRNRAEGWCRQG